MDATLASLEAALGPPGRAPQEAALLAALDVALARMDCVVGTIHRLDPATGMLHLIAQRGIPPMILDRVTTIPVGKGMAGLAAERLEPVQVCNLQTDDSGVAKPSARETRMEGSIAFPLLLGADGVGGGRDGSGRRLVGTMGVAKPVPYTFGPEEVALLERMGEAVAGRLAG